MFRSGGHVPQGFPATAGQVGADRGARLYSPLFVSGAAARGHAPQHQTCSVHNGLQRKQLSARMNAVYTPTSSLSTASC
eukprot:3416381-Pyramimonas_sp.AAC.1